MYSLIKNFFSRKEKNKEIPIIYKSTHTLGKDINNVYVPHLEIPKNNKKNILILDDNVEAADITLSDFKFIFNLSINLKSHGINNLTSKQEQFISKISNDLFKVLISINPNDYNIIIATTDMAAFSVYESLDNNAHYDYAILDILLGGYNKHNGKYCIPDGIDIAYGLVKSNKNIKYLFYSGCSLVDSSDETIKYFKLFNIPLDFNKQVILKDRDLYNKRLKLLYLLGEKNE